MQRSDALRERGLQQIGGVHRAAGGGAGADDRVDFVDEEDRVLVVLDLLDDLLQPLLEIAAIARAGQQRAHVEREDGRAGEHVGHFALRDLARQTLRDGGLADARVADEQRVVLVTAAEHLDRAQHLGLAADERIDAAVARFLVEIDAIGVERAFLLAAFAVATVAALAAVALVLDAARRARLVGETRALGDAMADVIHRVVARHVLLLQEIDGVAFALGEERDQHIGAADILAAGRLHADDGALDDALKAGGRLALVRVFIDQIVEFAIDVVAQILRQQFEIDRTGAQHRRGVGVLDKAEQQMFERGVFVMTLARGGEGAVQRFVSDCARTSAFAASPYFFSMMHCRGC